MRQPSAFFRMLLLGFWLIVPTLAAAAQRTDLNGAWLFRTDPKSEGESQGWFKSLPAGSEPVRVPHTWNIGKYDDYEGIAWYFRSFDLPALPPQKHVEIHFAATFYHSHVWVNGTAVGRQSGLVEHLGKARGRAGDDQVARQRIAPAHAHADA